MGTGLPRRVITIIAVLVLVAVGAIAWLIAGQGFGGALDRFERDAGQRAAAAKPRPATAETFRATICAASPCVLVEVGGLAFLVGAGEGAAAGLAQRGLLRADLDGVLLNDVSLASVEGLAAVQRAAFGRGRTAPLPVFGPDGLLTVIDGVNLVLAGSSGEGARLQVGAEGEEQGLAGKIVFDSGVVTIRAFAASRGGRLYRIDDGARSLIIAGCTASASDVLAAARGARVAAAIIATASSRLISIETNSAKAVGIAADAYPECMTPEDALQAVKDARLSGGLLAPLIPSANKAAWEEAATIPAGAKLSFAPAGTVMDLIGATPAITTP
jgi:hypothetical protein